MPEIQMHVKDKPHKKSKAWKLSSYVTGYQDKIVNWNKEGMNNSLNYMQGLMGL